MQRIDRGYLRLFLILVVIATAGITNAQAPVGGTKPTYIAKPLSSISNEQAIVKRFWAPGLDEGFTPQGLAVSGGHVHMVGYGATGCRIFSVSQANGVLSSILPASACKHGGGLAAIDGGRFVLIDTRALFVITKNRIAAQIKLGGELRGSYGDFDGTDLWIGSYNKDGPGRLWRIPLAKLVKASLTEADASESIVIPAGAQGMAFGRGALWMTFSGSRYGRLSRMDRKTGQELARYDMPAGIEDIGVDSAGFIWAVSEAGAKKYQGWSTNFPLIFAIDPARLR